MCPRYRPPRDVGEYQGITEPCRAVHPRSGAVSSRYRTPGVVVCQRDGDGDAAIGVSLGLMIDGVHFGEHCSWWPWASASMVGSTAWRAGAARRARGLPRPHTRTATGGWTFGETKSGATSSPPNAAAAPASAANADTDGADPAALPVNVKCRRTLRATLAPSVSRGPERTVTEFGLGPNRRRDRPSSSAGTWSNRSMPTSPNRDPASKVASSVSSVSSALSSSASKTASAASTAADAPTSELLHTVASEVRSLVQSELTSARREITGKVFGARPAMAKLGAAGVLGAMAAGTSAATLVRALDRVLPRTASALAATALLGGRRRPGRRGPRGAAADGVARSGGDGAERQGGRRRGCRGRLHQLRLLTSSWPRSGRCLDPCQAHGVHT